MGGHAYDEEELQMQTEIKKKRNMNSTQNIPIKV